MSSPDPRRTGATATREPTTRRPWWAWLLLALLAIVILVAIILLVSQCGTSAGPPPPGGPAAAAGGPPPGAPAAGNAPPRAPASAGPASAGPAPGGPGPGGGVSDAPGAGGPGGGGPATQQNVAGVASRVNAIVAASPLLFGPDSAALTDAGTATVNRTARELASAPTARVTVTGYAAPVGTSDMPDPQQLSAQRATTVARQLAAMGVSADRVATRGAADSAPLSTPRASRRAELTIS